MVTIQSLLGDTQPTSKPTDQRAFIANRDHFFRTLETDATQYDASSNAAV